MGSVWDVEKTFEHKITGNYGIERKWDWENCGKQIWVVSDNSPIFLHLPETSRSVLISLCGLIRWAGWVLFWCKNLLFFRWGFSDSDEPFPAESVGKGEGIVCLFLFLTWNLGKKTLRIMVIIFGFGLWGIKWVFVGGLIWLCFVDLMDDLFSEFRIGFGNSIWVLGWWNSLLSSQFSFELSVFHLRIQGFV